MLAFSKRTRLYFVRELSVLVASIAFIGIPVTVQANDLQDDNFAELLPLEWKTESLQLGVMAFLDTDFVFTDLPKELIGKDFIRTNFIGTRKVCTKPGLVYAITPIRRLQSFSQVPELERRGFRLVKGIAEFAPFGEQWDGLLCNVYAKHVEKDERIDLPSPKVVLKSHPSSETQPVPISKGKWCIIIAETPMISGSVGAVSRRQGSPFDPPLAQHYTIAAEVPSLRYFIHDPGFIQLPNGEFIAFSPCWKRPSRVGKKEGGYIIVTKSKNGGKTWERMPDLPYAEATPFLAQDKLYLFTQPKQHQDVYYMCSSDNGESWTEAVKVMEGPFWNCQTNFVEKDENLYWVLDKNHQGTVAIAGDLSMDLLDPKAWRVSNFLEPVMTPPEFRPTGTKRYASQKEKSRFRDWNLEGNLMLVDDQIRIAARVNPNPGGTPAIATLFDLEDKNGQLTLSYDQHYPWPGAQSKFAILHDSKTNLFWMACNLAMGPLGEEAPDRRYLMLYFGHDGLNWLPAGCVAFAPTPGQSFMYPSMLIDGDDIVILSRTARESGHFHDADLSTFHRIKDFRLLAWY
ncbi:sialidase family protein [Bythopirellula goksoeyrii]|nr:sialidase family protein [Bythopirellula goksoeyrii]